MLMKHGFIKVGAATFDITLAAPHKNAEKIIELTENANAEGVKVLVFPELSLCGATCGDLFFSNTLTDACRDALCHICDATADCDTIIIIGFPLVVNDKIYNCAAFCQKGDILGVLPKKYLHNSEKRYFAEWSSHTCQYIDDILKHDTLFGDVMLRVNDESGKYLFTLGADVGDEAFAPCPPSTHLCLSGASIIVNPFAESETVGAEEYKRTMLCASSARNICTYIHAGAGDGESTTNGVYGGFCAVYENGKLLAERSAFTVGGELTVTETDIQLLSGERRRSPFTFDKGFGETDGCGIVSVELTLTDTTLTRKISPSPFIPACAADIPARCERILTIQAKGLAARITKAYARTVVIGISGGLDSCLAVLVAAKAMDILGRPHTDIIGVTMPCFGTTSRTKSNAELLCESLGTSFKCVDIGVSVRQHFADIGHDESDHSVVYENAQARERTQVIMDIANMEDGFVVGTGDLSELALGWATYNGDHMSMYGVNGGVPKTLIRHVVAYCADVAESDGKCALAEVLRDILDTPVSPELLPADENGDIAQRTEDLVGPYEIHDFYIYYLLRYGFSPDKLYRLAQVALGDKYSDEELKKWLCNLIRRFFAQQFKRSCLPDGPKVGTVGVSPRGDLLMPSDASNSEWFKLTE